MPKRPDKLRSGPFGVAAVVVHLVATEPNCRAACVPVVASRPSRGFEAATSPSFSHRMTPDPILRNVARMRDAL